MLVFLGILLTVLFGLLVSLVISVKIHPLERLGLSYVLGLGLLTFLMFLGYVVGLKFTLTNTTVILLVSIIFLLILTRNSIKSFFRELKALKKFPSFSLSEKLIIFVLVGLFIYSFVLSLYWPVADWDALALYDFRAKIFVDTGAMVEGIRRGYFFGYPLLSSLADAWIYFLGGNNPKFIYSLFFFTFILMFYGATRRIGARRTALLSTLLLATTSSIFSHSTMVYTNLPYTVYLVMGTVYLYFWLIKKETGYLFLSALMIGLSTWTRSTEPFWLTTLVIVVLYSLVRKKPTQLLLYLLIFFSIQQPWKIYESQMAGKAFSTTSQISVGLSTVLTGIDFDRIRQVLEYIYQNVISFWYPILLLFLAVIFLQIKNFFRQQNLIFLIMIIINFLFLLVGTYIFSFSPFQWKEIPGSAARMSMFFIPLFIFYVASSKTTTTLFQVIKKREK